VVRILGRVFLDANADGKWDEEEAGIPGAVVEVEAGERYLVLALTDREGRYVVEMPVCSVYRVRAVQVPAGHLFTTRSSYIVHRGRETEFDLDFGLRRTTGHVLLWSLSGFTGFVIGLAVSLVRIRQAILERSRLQEALERERRRWE